MKTYENSAKDFFFLPVLIPHPFEEGSDPSGVWLGAPQVFEVLGISPKAPFPTPPSFVPAGPERKGDDIGRGIPNTPLEGITLLPRLRGDVFSF